MKNIKSFSGKVLVILVSVGLFAFSPVSAATDSQPSSNSHATEVTVQKGDTLYSLARKYHTTVPKLMAMNNLSSYTIYIGQKLVVSEEEVALYKVIAGSFKERENAQSRVNFLKKQGMDAFITEKKLGREIYYRVQAGAFRHKVNANVLLAKVKKAGVTGAFIEKEAPLNINGVSPGDSYDRLLKMFGSPSQTAEKYNIKSLNYNNEVGVQVKFNMANGTMDEIIMYPNHLNRAHFDYIPRTEQETIQQYSYPNQVDTVSCMSNSSCRQFIYEDKHHRLEVQFALASENVEMIRLSNRP